MTEEQRRTLGVRLQEARRRAGLTQGQVARRCGVSAKHISCVERGVIGLSVELLGQLGALYGTGVDSFLEGLFSAE